MFLSIMIFQRCTSSLRVVVSWLTAALSLRNVAFLSVCNVAIPFLSIFPAPDCPLRQPELICNLNQLCSLLVHFMGLLYPYICFPRQPHHLSFICFDVTNPLRPCDGLSQHSAKRVEFRHMSAMDHAGIEPATDRL